MKIRVGDFKITDEEKRAIIEVLDSGRLSEGPKVKEFESKWAEFIGAKYCISTSSGSGALMVGLTAIKYKHNLPAGSKIITTPLTYIADSSAIVSTGFEPIYVDVDPLTFCITPEAIESHLAKMKKSKNYVAILPVDLMGYSVKIDEINSLAKKYNLLVFEDAAQAHGTKYKGKIAGSQALLALYSFYIAHNVQAGEMGALVTNDPEISKLAKKLKAQGRACDCSVCTRVEGKCPRIFTYKGDDDFDPRFSHDYIGYNFKTMEFQAALGLTQLKKVDFIKKRRQENIKYLNKGLEKFSDLLQLPKYSDNISYLVYPLVIKKPRTISRKELRAKLELEGIETRPLFGSIPTQQPAFSYLKSKYIGKLPNADFIGLNGFYVGCHQYLQKSDLKYMVEAFKKILNKSKSR